MRGVGCVFFLFSVTFYIENKYKEYITYIYIQGSIGNLLSLRAISYMKTVELYAKSEEIRP